MLHDATLQFIVETFMVSSDLNVLIIELHTPICLPNYMVSRGIALLFTSLI